MSNATNVANYSVSEISQAIKRTVEENFDHVRIRGEITGFRGQHSSGHAYFSLKDEKARLEAVVWRGTYSKLKTKPEEGMEVIVTGKITTYSGSSKYQIVIEQIEPAGIGALMAQLEARRKKYAALGAFDADRKQPIPFLPCVIGIVTSPTGAVIRDILHRLADRFPTHVLLWPVRVQGETSGDEVARAVRGLNRLGEYDLPLPDVIIVARGGGSFEDLWGFNDEAVIEAVAQSTLPVISAVGHETDTTLIDFVADLRAPTPTAAAEFAVPVRTELSTRVDETGLRVLNALNKAMRLARLNWDTLDTKLDRHQDPVGQRAQRLDVAAQNLNGLFTHQFTRRQDRFAHLSQRYAPRLLKIHMSQSRLKKHNLGHQLDRLAQKFGQSAHERLAQTLHLGTRIRRVLDRQKERLDRASALLNSLCYTNVLKRGYSVIKNHDGTIATSTKTLQGPRIAIQFHDGNIAATLNSKQQTAEPKSEPPKASEKKAKSSTNQGSLF